MSWSTIGILLAVPAIALGLRAPLRLALFAACTVAFVALICVLQYKDDEPNPWYVDAAPPVLLAVVLTVIALLVAAASRRPASRE